MLRLLDRLVGFVVGAVALALIATAFGQVVARYVFSQSFVWVLEVDVLLMVWLALLSGYLGVRRHGHMATDFLIVRLGEAARRRLAFAVHLLCALLVAVIGWNSLAVVDAMRGMYFVSIPLEQTALYMSLPVGMALMLVALVAEMRAMIGGERR
ncbi:MAG: TRAP transporter small permease [Burkholderiaceae bacterium]|nr:TRAP transporter small permease [Burkholderiaceae bacterium]